MSLATPADISARLGRPLADDEGPRVQAFLDDATALVEEYCTGRWDRATPPAIFKTVVCGEVIRWLSVAPGVILERTGELETQFGQTASNQGLSREATAALRKYRRKVGSLPLRRYDC
ncbi:hypothetical protein ABZT34_10590 [Streptomyces sp. NPDC005329]|uniref:hypothetical protein n=1 Tax=Streptomyces sp. NPDC005329 TaxID=3157034 RepID=UPI0033B9EF54